jgi:hypothetical protein
MWRDNGSRLRAERRAGARPFFAFFAFFAGPLSRTPLPPGGRAAEPTSRDESSELDESNPSSLPPAPEVPARSPCPKSLRKKRKKRKKGHAPGPGGPPSGASGVVVRRATDLWPPAQPSVPARERPPGLWPHIVAKAPSRARSGGWILPRTPRALGRRGFFVGGPPAYTPVDFREGGRVRQGARRPSLPPRAVRAHPRPQPANGRSLCGFA